MCQREWGRFRFGVIAHLVCQEARQLHGSHRFGRLRVGYHVAAAQPLVGLVDAHGRFLPIERVRREGQELSLADAGPIQHLEDHERARVVHRGVGEPQILVLGPETHRSGFLAAHFHGSHRGVGAQPVVPFRVVQDGGELVVECSQVRGAVGLSVVCVGRHEGVLPADDVDGAYLVHLLVREEGQHPRLDRVLLLPPGVLAQPGA